MFELKFKSQSERHSLRVKEPHIQSFAAALMLKRHYQFKVCPLGKHSKTRLRVWLTFRNKYLRRQKRITGSLICAYCKTPYLDPNFHNPCENGRRKATVDHIYPLSKGGVEFDEKNLAVACSRCNGRKGDKLCRNMNMQTST